jgi:hypothetical protein
MGGKEKEERVGRGDLKLNVKSWEWWFMSIVLALREKASMGPKVRDFLKKENRTEWK